MSDIIKKMGKVGKKLYLDRIPGTKNLYRELYRVTSDKYVTPYTPDQRLQKDEYEVRKLAVGDYILCLPPKYYDRWHQTNILESEEAKSISRVVNEGNIVVDIGGHLGRSLIPLHESVGGSGRVIVFEPIPPWIYYLNRTVEENRLRNVDIENAALAEETGTKIIRIPEAETSQSSILTTEDISEEKYSKAHSTEVSSIRLSDYLIEHEIQHIDFAKIDIEGGEYNLICETDTLNSIRKALIELHFSKMGEKNSQNVINELSNLGRLKTLSGGDLSKRELEKEATESSRTHILWHSNSK